MDKVSRGAALFCFVKEKRGRRGNLKEPSCQKNKRLVTETIFQLIEKGKLFSKILQKNILEHPNDIIRLHCTRLVYE